MSSDRADGIFNQQPGFHAGRGGGSHAPSRRGSKRSGSRRAFSTSVAMAERQWHRAALVDVGPRPSSAPCQSPHQPAPWQPCAPQSARGSRRTSPSCGSSLRS